jgi:hypothetical protein
MGTTQWRILEQLPDLRTQIIDRLAGDTDFQSLCHDYDRCAVALGRFREEAEIVPDRIEEYEQLLAELEKDILQALDIE